jgi:hypothetical protein
MRGDVAIEPHLAFRLARGPLFIYVYVVYSASNFEESATFITLPEEIKTILVSFGSVHSFIEMEGFIINTP